MTRTYAAKAASSMATPMVQSPGSRASAPIQAKASATTPDQQLERSSQLGQNFEQAKFSPEALQPATSGRPLPKPLREKMESAFDTDFSDVRVHEDGNAEKIGALAYTRGHNLHFVPGQFRPHSAEGRKIIGHELTHVMQQRAGEIAKPESEELLINSDKNLEAEADALGTQLIEPSERTEESKKTSSQNTSSPSNIIQCWVGDDKEKDHYASKRQSLIGSHRRINNNVNNPNIGFVKEANFNTNTNTNSNNNVKPDQINDKYKIKKAPPLDKGVQSEYEKDKDGKWKKKETGQTQDLASFTRLPGYATEAEEWRGKKLHEVSNHFEDKGYVEKTRYLNAEQRKQHELTFVDGLAHQGKAPLSTDGGGILSGRGGANNSDNINRGQFIYVMDKSGKFYAADMVGEIDKGKDKKTQTQYRFHHSSFLEGGEKGGAEGGKEVNLSSKQQGIGVAGAGAIKSSAGQVERFSNDTGHYQTDAVGMYQVAKQLSKNNAGIERISADFVAAGGKQALTTSASELLAYGGDPQAQTKMLLMHDRKQNFLDEIKKRGSDDGANRKTGLKEVGIKKDASAPKLASDEWEKFTDRNMQTLVDDSLNRPNESRIPPDMDSETLNILHKIENQGKKRRYLPGDRHYPVKGGSHE